MEDYYSILGVNRLDDLEVIKKAYRRLALSCHPDKGFSSERFQQINEAWSVLSDPIKRANYDKLFHADEDVVAQEVFPFSEFEFCMSDESYYHNCRCGGKFEIFKDEVSEKIDLVQCTECSLVCQILYTE